MNETLQNKRRPVMYVISLLNAALIVFDEAAHAEIVEPSSIKVLNIRLDNH